MQMSFQNGRSNTDYLCVFSHDFLHGNVILRAAEFVPLPGDNQTVQ